MGTKAFPSFKSWACDQLDKAFATGPVMNLSDLHGATSMLVARSREQDWLRTRYAHILLHLNRVF
jgi:hypothetical protein